jgi:asparagine synthetase B (glutamine-hydrolysing)
MCGIIGAFGDIDFNVQHAVEDLLQMDVIRGPHSTGMCIVGNPAHAPVVIKDIGGPEVILGHPTYDANVKFANILMLGHNRFATTGKVKRQNAHPFRSKHITLVHNGTLINQTYLETDKKFETDSEAITYAIAKEGVDFAWKNLDGAATLVWWNKDDSTLNILRNHQRPLHFMYTKDRDCIIWASEAWMLRGVCARRGIKIEDDQMWYPTPDTLFSYSIDDGEVVSTARKLEKFSWVGRNLIDRSPWVRRIEGNKTLWERNRAARDRWETTLLDQQEDPNLEWDDDKLDWIRRGAAHQAPQHKKRTRPPKNRAQPPRVIMLEGMVGEELPYNLDQENAAAKKMNYIEFIRTYEQCIFCQDHFTTKEDYHGAVILDEEQAVCKPCVDVAHTHNMSVSGVVL